MMYYDQLTVGHGEALSFHEVVWRMIPCWGRQGVAVEATEAVHSIQEVEGNKII